MNEQEPSSEPLLVAATRDRARQADGSQRDFAVRVGLHPGTLARWMKKGSIPPSAYPLLAGELGLPESALKVLAAVTVRQACQLVLEQGVNPPA